MPETFAIRPELSRSKFNLIGLHAAGYTRSPTPANTMDEQWYEPLRWTLSATPPDSDIVAKLLAVSRAVKIKDFHLICPLSTLLRAAAPVLATVQMREAFRLNKRPTQEQ